MSGEVTVKDLWNQARRLRLKGVNYCCVYSIEEMEAAYNGCGPEWMPKRARSVLDAVLRPFGPCFLLHDVEWATNDGTKRLFEKSNEELRDNCLKIADMDHAWYSPMRYIRRHQAHVVYVACRDFGRSAYDAAYAAQRK